MQYVTYSPKTESCSNSTYTFIETFVSKKTHPISGKKGNIIEDIFNAVLTGKGGLKEWHTEMDGGWKTTPDAKTEFATIFPAPRTISALESIISMSKYPVYLLKKSKILISNA